MNARLRLKEWPARSPLKVQRGLRLLGMLIGISLVYFSYLAGSTQIPVIVGGIVIGFRNAMLVREKSTEARPTLSGVLREELRGLIQVLALSCLAGGIAWTVVTHGPDRWYGLMVAAMVAVLYVAYACWRGPSDDGAVAALLVGLGLTAGGAVGVATAQGTGWVAALTCLVAGCVILALLAYSLWRERRHRRLDPPEPRQASLLFKPCRIAISRRPAGLNDGLGPHS